MATIIYMPGLSPTMETGAISSWEKKVGDKINVGDIVAQIETDKAIMEYEMPDAGFLRAILVEPGAETAVGVPIAIMTDTPDEDIAAVSAELAQPVAPPQPAEQAQPTPTNPVAEPTQAETPPPEPKTLGATAAPQPSESLPQASNGRVRISPYARKLAIERGIDWHSLSGSGVNGRIVADDVKNAQAPRPTPQGQPVATAEVKIVKLSMMRKAIATAMLNSKQNIPHFQVRRKIRVEALLNARQQLNATLADAETPVKLSVNDLIIKAVACALMKHPEVNCQFSGDEIKMFPEADIAVAVGTDSGLLTPIIWAANHKSMVEISTEMKSLAGRARDKKLAPEEYNGGSFTISNLGMFGVTEFNAIINAPQASILAVSGMVTEPVVEDGSIVVGQTMNLTLSSDHRIVDGLLAAKFMQSLTEFLTEPIKMLI